MVLCFLEKAVPPPEDYWKNMESLGSSCSITNAASAQFVILDLFSDIAVMEYSSATAQRINVFAYEEKRILDQIPAQ